MRVLVWCSVLNVVWLGLMAFGALQQLAHFDLRAQLGTGIAWVLATTASWSLLRRSDHRPAFWEVVVVTAPAALVALVLTTTIAGFISPPVPTRPLAVA